MAEKMAVVRLVNYMMREITEVIEKGGQSIKPIVDEQKGNMIAGLTIQGDFNADQLEDIGSILAFYQGKYAYEEVEDE